MELLRKIDDKHLWLENFKDENDISPLYFNNQPFVTIVWNNHEGFISTALIEKLLKMHCKYFLAGGYNSQEWENTVDQIYLSLYPDFNPPESEHVMTTSHPNESLEEVVRFALNNTNFDHHDFKHFLIIQIGSNYSKEEILKFITSSSS